jgi:hypothetical protein
MTRKHRVIVDIMYQSYSFQWETPVRTKHAAVVAPPPLPPSGLHTSSSMRATARSSLLLSLYCLAVALLLWTPPAAAAAHSKPARAHHHGHIPLMDPVQQKLQAELQKHKSHHHHQQQRNQQQQQQQQQQRAEDGENQDPVVSPGAGALNPACVPKYVSDLVLLPPMPASAKRMQQVRVTPVSRDGGPVGLSALVAGTHTFYE